MNKRTRNALPLNLVMRLARETATATGVTVPSWKYLRAELAHAIPNPQLFENGSCLLWVDRFYIAYQTKGETCPTEYVYLTHAHISEEYRSEKRMRAQGRDGFLDATTFKQYAAAWRAMKAGNCGFAVRELLPSRSADGLPFQTSRWKTVYGDDVKESFDVFAGWQTP